MEDFFYLERNNTKIPLIFLITRCFATRSKHRAALLVLSRFQLRPKKIEILFGLEVFSIR